MPTPVWHQQIMAKKKMKKMEYIKFSHVYTGW